MDEVEFIEEEGGFSEHHSLLCSATSKVLFVISPFRIFFSVTPLAFPQNFCCLYYCFFLQCFTFIAFSFCTETFLPYNYLHL